jgi:hypothetical protein
MSNISIFPIDTMDLQGDYKYPYDNYGLEDFNIKVNETNFKVLIDKINSLVNIVNDQQEQIEHLKNKG